MKLLTLGVLMTTLAACGSGSDQSNTSAVAAVDSLDAGISIVNPEHFIAVFACDAFSLDVTHPVNSKKIRIEKEYASDSLLRVVWRGEANNWLGGAFTGTSEAQLSQTMDLELYQYAGSDQGNTQVGRFKIDNGEGYLTMNTYDLEREEVVLKNCQASAPAQPAPTMAQCIQVKDELWNSYSSLNSAGVGRQNGQCVARLGFVAAEDKAAFISQRLAQGLDPASQTITLDNGQSVKVGILSEVTGPVVIQPVAGVSN